jgi:hypothetical protein
MRSTIATILGTMVCLAALSVWFYSAPAMGSQVFLLIAFLGVVIFNFSWEAGPATAINSIMMTATGIAWWLSRLGATSQADSIYPLVFCFLCALAAFGKSIELMQESSPSPGFGESLRYIAFSPMAPEPEFYQKIRARRQGSGI